MAVLDYTTIFALTSNVHFCCLIVVRSVDPVDRVGIIGLLIRVVLDVVIASPLESDIPVAIANNARREQALGVLRVILNARRNHEGVLTTTVTDSSDHDERIIQLLQLGIHCSRELSATVTHNDDEVCPGRALLSTIVDLLCTSEEVFLHLIGVILASKLEVHLTFFKQRATSRGGATVGIQETHLSVPLPNLTTNEGVGHRCFGSPRKRSRSHVLNLSVLEFRQLDLARDQRLNDTRSRDHAKFCALAKAKKCYRTYKHSDQELRKKRGPATFIVPDISFHCFPFLSVSVIAVRS